MTSHLESCGGSVSINERKQQLMMCFQQIINTPSDRIVLFGGDLNLRESEVRLFHEILPGEMYVTNFIIDI